MDTAGSSSHRMDAFPSGLRVLVVDDDLTWLKILEKMLKKCFYEVTTCCLAREALSILRERKDGFDIVISDVNMPDMDGFKLLEHVGLEMDLPVIMMSVDGETSRVMKGVQHGACDYLLKPIRMKELRNIWQHVLRKRIHEVRDVESHESFEAIQMMRIGCDQANVGYYLNGGGDVSATRKRKDVDNKVIERELGDGFAKRARVVWTVDLHQKFVKAVNLVGLEKIGPKKILDSMNVPWLTRENVASHLQKYRLYLSRLQRDNGDKPFEMSNHLDLSFCMMKHSDMLTSDSEEISFGPQEPVTNIHIDASSGASSSNRYFNGDLRMKDTKSKDFMLSGLKTEANTGLNADAPEAQNRNIPWLNSSQDFVLVESDAQFSNQDSNITSKYSWNGEIRGTHYEHVSQQRQRIYDGISHWPLHPQLNHRKPSLSVDEGCSHSERDIMAVTVVPHPRVDHLNASLSENVVKAHSERETPIGIFPPSAEQGTPHDRRKGKAPLEHRFGHAFDDPYTSNLQLVSSIIMPSPSVYSGAYNRETQTSSSVESKVPCTEQESSSSSVRDRVSSEAADTFRARGRFLDHQSFKPIGAPGFDDIVQSHKNAFEPADSELALVAFGKDYKAHWDHGEWFSSNSYDFHDSNETDLMASVPLPFHMYDALRFTPGFPMMDQSLSIADAAHFSSSYYPVS
ncbi:unnamed protein product [Rhodiola kirilowii]